MAYPALSCKKGNQKNETAEKKSAAAGTPVCLTTRLKLCIFLPNQLVSGISLVMPYKVRDDTYKEVFEAESTLKMRQPLMNPARVWYPAAQAAFTARLVEFGGVGGPLAVVELFDSPP
jgi:hypothetical protein